MYCSEGNAVRTDDTVLVNRKKERNWWRPSHGLTENGGVSLARYEVAGHLAPSAKHGFRLVLEVEVPAKSRHEIKGEIVKPRHRSVQQFEVLRRCGTAAQTVMLVDGCEERQIFVVTEFDIQLLSESTASNVSGWSKARRNRTIGLTSNPQRRLERSTVLS